MAAVVPELFLQLPERFNPGIRQKLKAVRKIDTRKNSGPLIAKHEELCATSFVKKEPLPVREFFTAKASFHETSPKKEPTVPSFKVGSPSAIQRPDSPIPSVSTAASYQLPLSPVEPSGDLLSNKNDGHFLRRPSSLTALTVVGSGSRSRPSSPSQVPMGRRTPSPASVADPSVIEAVKQRIRKVQRARLYLLQQLGPHSFTIGADSPEHKYKVIIGPQSCTCGKGPHCIHVLFIMLRVFQVRENDSKLYCKHLKNYEVEELIAQFHQRRKKQLDKGILANRGSSRVQGKSISHLSKSESSLQEATRNEQSKRFDVEDEGLLCPICLLEMVEGESLVTCENGCRNKLHQHCIAIWGEECIRQNECILCPLCRARWPSLQKNNCHTTVFATRNPTATLEESFANSPACTHSLSSVRPAHVSLDSKELLTWEQIFGKEFVSSLVSSNWADREKSLKWLARQVVSILALSQQIPDPGGGLQSKWYGDYRVVVKNCCSIIACMVPDPVYKVYIASLRCLRAVLTYTLCMGENDLLNLQNLVRPIVKAVLLKCANGSRTSQLSIATLLEMTRGQAGSLGVGSKTRQPSVTGLGGVDFVLNCALEEDHTKSFSNWQWLLGRLAVFERLIEEFPQEFYLLYVNLHSSNAQLVGEMAPYKLFNYNRLMMLLRFTKNALSHPHSTVNKMARTVFLMAARLSAHIPPVFSQVFDIISDLDPILRGLLLKKLDSLLQELQSPKVWPTENLPSKVPTKNNIPRNVTADLKLVQEKLVYGDDAPFVSNLTRFSMRSVSFSNTVEKNGLPLSRCKSSNDFGNDRKPQPPSRPTFLPLFNSNSYLLKKHSDQTAFKKDGSRTRSASHPSHYSNMVRTDLGNQMENSIQPLALRLSATNLCVFKGEVQEDEDSVDDLIDLSPSLTLTSCSSPLSFGSDIETPLSPATEAGMAKTRGSSKQREVVLDGMLAVALAEDNCRSQFNFPLIPGLRNSPDEELSITLQPDLAEYSQIQNCSDYGSYVEGIHWLRGPQLGTGAFSTCYQARDVQTGTLMAVKQVSYYRNAEDEQDKVMNEIREEIVMMAKLKHPNILRILGATEQGGHYNFFVET